MHAICHGVALVAVAVGIVADVELLVLAGALTGALGGIAFLWFTLGVTRHVVAFHSEKNSADQP